MDFNSNPLYWGAFLVFVAVLLALDLGILNRKAHAPSLRESAALSAVWISIALVFGLFVWFGIGPRQGIEYYTGWVLEKALSVDNLFVFVVIFSFFRVPPEYHHRVLFWGILGAIIMRGILIVIGASLLHQFEWIIYIFGAFLIYTGIKLSRQSDDEEPEVGKNPILRLAQRVLPLASDYHEEKFLVRHAGRLLFTPLVLVLIVVETTDLVFAVDSIPAVIAVTKEPFIIFTSNIMAILGLRALYFLLAAAMTQFRYLKPALAFILTFIGLKMVVEKFFHDPIHGFLHDVMKVGDPEYFLVVASLVIVLVVLVFGVVASIVYNRRHPGEHTHIKAAEHELAPSEAE